MSAKDRRINRRFSMKLPLTVKFSGTNAVPAETREVSSRGVYFYMQKEVKNGTPIEFLITLPHEITLAGPVKVRCLGHVVRSEPREENRVGVVVAIDRYEFLRGDKTAA